ncbi:hypothetical protein RB201_26605 [Streptomyces sp. S1A(2023)]
MPRLVRAQHGECGGHDPGDGRRQRGEGEAGADRALDGRDGALGFVHGGEDPVGMFEEDTARLRKRDGPPVRAQEINPDVVSQCGELLGNGTGRQRQGLGGRGDGAAGGDGPEHVQTAYIQHEPIDYLKGFIRDHPLDLLG